MFRWARNIICGLSLVLFLALLFTSICLRKFSNGISLKRTDTVPYANATTATPHFYFFEVQADRLVFGHWRHPDFIEAGKQSQKQLLASLQEMRADMAKNFDSTPDPWRSRLSEHIIRLDKQISETRQDHGKNFYDRPDGFYLGAHGGIYATPIAAIPTFAGIKFDSFPSFRYPATGFRCVVPIWWVLPFLLIAPLVRGISLWRSRRRRQAGHCSFCGYDLRASSNKCPECGVERM
ncbi:MAG TPA: hypothetical protein VGQ99_19970 [Tepidisphaeraceae bacterium]|jgi:hypothetical protein|nr:hypothetical protein [Tepidisphaeraceae bacterium]